MGKEWFHLMDLKEATLAGRFVLLEPLRLEHARELFPDALEPGLFQHLAPGAEASLADLEAWIRRRLDDQKHGTALPFLQRDAKTRKAIGATCMFNISRRHHRVEIGHTWLAKSHRGGPVNTESKQLLLEHAFVAMGAIRVQFKVDVRNEAGIRALERIGAVREGLMRAERVLTDGHVRDAYVYSIIASEWSDVRTQLNGLLWAYRASDIVQQKRQPPKIPGLHPDVTPPVQVVVEPTLAVRPTPHATPRLAALPSKR